MKNIKKIGLSALAGALAMTSAHAGSLTVAGEMEVSYTKGGGKSTTSNPLGQANTITFTGAGELDNGITVAYKRTTTDAFAADDSELVFGNILGGTLAFQSTGSPLDGIDNKTPTAFKDAEGMTGSINDVAGANGDFGIRYTLADLAGSGWKLDYNYVPQHGSGDAVGDEGFSGGAHGNEDAHDITLTGSVPGIEGLNVGAGYAFRNTDIKAATGVDANDSRREDGTAYATYAFGALTVGYQVGAVSNAGAAGVAYKNTYMGISYAVSDDLSVSYNNTESQRLAGGPATTGIVQDWDSVSLSYSMGGATLNIADSDCGNCNYTSGRGESERTISLTVAF
jgi:outer membrane protein OmpU